jgi:ubiquitin-protein ligase
MTTLNLDNEINQQLSIIVNPSIRKRISRELTGLFDKHDNNYYLMSVDVKDKYYKNKEYYPYSIKLYEISTNRIYEFLLGNNYPFYPPKLNINDKPYSYYYKPSLNSFNELLLKYKKIRCLCCKTMICGDNWSPAFTIPHIIKEVHEFANYFKEISNRAIIKVIKRKYLNPDINLIEWLF